MIIQGRNDAARALGVAPATLREWMRDPAFPDCTNGHDIEAINAWRIEKQNNRQGVNNSDELELKGKIQLQLSGEKLKQAIVETKKKQLELDVKEGQLFPRQAAELALATVFTELSDAWDQMSDVITTTAKVPKKYQPALRRRIVEEFDAMRARLRDTVESTLRDLDTADE